MHGFGLLVGHLVGDYLLQNGWMATNKHILKEDDAEQQRHGNYACTVHCLVYTLAVWAFSWQWMPWWGLLVCFLAHWPVDRFRLARLWMFATNWHRDFATGPLAPWSIVVVDNTVHLVVLYLIGFFAGA